MAKMLNMMKQVRQARKMQKHLAAKTVEVSSNDGAVTVTARGDMSIKSIRIKPEALDPAACQKLERLLVSIVNGALDSSKKAAAADMAGLTGSLGDLSSMLGG